ncbi:MAG TPA: hypothetical protein VMW17_07845 [Candidatus Binatia bacterium]|nr:hypothetical protein [Candidatus Binatia bacterium]
MDASIRWRRAASVITTVGTLWMHGPTQAQSLPSRQFWQVVRLEADVLPWLHGVAERQLSVVACRSTCAPIPWQLDERDPDGRFVLDHGEPTNFDDPPGVVDANDLILFMASDSGRAVPQSLLPAGFVGVTEVEISDPDIHVRGWVYLLQYPHDAPRSATSYVAYDPAADRLTGARVALGFERGTPRWLALIGTEGSGANRLDRMKVRASASFLWGLFTVRRTEDDVLTLPIAWHGGPIRVIRRQPFWIRLSWRWRTPIFMADTLFYRDFAEMPVTLHLNFTPRLLFANVAIRVSLDFRDLAGWEVETIGDQRVRVNGEMTADKRALSHAAGRWFALHGPDLTLVQALTLSDSLSGLGPRIYYRESRTVEDPPESVAGALPDIGYTLTGWDQVRSGDHWFAATAYALPRERSVEEFLAALGTSLHVEARQMRAAETRSTQ